MTIKNIKTGLKLWSVNTDHYLNEAKRLFDLGVYDYIELYVVPDTTDTLSAWKTLNIPFIIHNAHFAHGFNLAKSENKARNKEIYEQSRLFADKLSAKYIIFHGGIDGDANETANQLASFKEQRALIENKPFVALPNRMGGNFCRGATIDELKLIMDTASCGMCFDIGHAVCSANSQNIEPYAFLKHLKTLSPVMYHLSDINDMKSPYDAHPHLGTGNLDIKWVIDEIFHEGAYVSVETNKDSKESLEDFKKDICYLKNCQNI